MRPLRIEMEGFGAFRERTVVDFDGAEFFALVGPTGSGKSTVLDALCFALYGSVPRYDDERLIAPVLSLGATEARVSLRFESGGQAYVVTRVLRRQRERVTTKEARLERVVGDGTEVLAGSERELRAGVEAVVGLPFTHFTKCVLLPQGEFARFLHDKPSDRQEVLVKLLDLGVYAAMAKVANGRATQADAAALLAASRRADLGDVSDAALADAEARVRAVAAARRAVTEIGEEIERFDDEVRSLRAQHAQAVSLADALGRVAVPPDAARLAAELRTAHDDVLAGERSEAEANTAVLAAEQRLAALPPLDELRLAEAAHTELAAARARRPGAIAERAHAASVVTAADSQRTAAIDARAAALRAAGERLASADAAVAATETALAACPAAEVLAVAAHTHAQLAKALADEGTLADALTAAETAVAAAATRLADAEAGLLTARQVREAVETAHAAHVVAGRLVPGDPCPACGETVTRLPLPGSAPPPLAGARDAEARADAERSAAQQHAAAAQSRRTALVDRRDALDQVIASLRDELGAYDDPGALDDAVVRRRTATTAHDEAIGARERVRRETDAARTGADVAVESATAAHAVALTALASAEAALQHLDARITELRAAVMARPDPLAVAVEIGSVNVAVAALDSARAAAARARAGLDARRAAAVAKERALVSARDAFDAQRLAVGALDPPAPARADLVDDWQVLVDWAAARLTEQREVVAAAQRGGAAVVAERKAAFERALVAVAAVGVVVGGATELNGLRDAVAARAATVTGDLERVRVVRARDATLAAEETAQRAKASVAQELARLLNARNFEKWLVSTALRVLVDGASIVLERLSGGAFALTLDGTDDFAVVDHRNADEIRPARTLSGGETFQASLALALALAEQLQGLSADPNRRLEAIFLDEGFGTLDADTLETVAATIETLGADGRMVGIVTHVRELADRVPVRFVVSRGPRSSRVERVEL